MGGAKCSYRNCTIRSDGVTHMFHYPVFDKIRCHQWLTNAQRQDFLNLKVSQLKNRVICQHHFKPDSFMNYKMDKLKFDAVPTENGPFCDAPDVELQYGVKVLPIAPDDIENDNLSLDEKKKNFSVKYAEFLTNSDLVVIDENPIMVQRYDPSNTDKIIGEYVPVDQKKNKMQMKEITSQNAPLKRKKIHIISEKKISTPVSLKSSMLKPVMPNSIIKPVTPNSVIKPHVRKTDNVENMEMFHSPIANLAKTDTLLTNSDILFNNPQTLVDPQNVLLEHSSIALPPMIENCEPSKILVPNEITDHKNNAENSKPMYMVTLESDNVLKETKALKSKNDEVNKIIDKSQSPKSLLKNKIPPERVAAIEEKRQFNKKLRDMIEFCLDDSPKVPINQNNKIIESEKRDNVQNSMKIVEEEKKKTIEDRRVSQHADKQGNLKSEKVASFLSKDTSLPSHNDYNMASLEARLKKMEDNLLSKITQNSKNILDLKNVLQSIPVTKYTVATQTKEDNETTKKQLYEEISKFLSPETSSLIYEELFLNKFDPARYSRKRKLRQPNY